MRHVVVVLYVLAVMLATVCCVGWLVFIR